MAAALGTLIIVETKHVVAGAHQIFGSVVQVPTTGLWWLAAAAAPEVRPATETKIGVAMVAV
jgi:hypothetical protein